MFVLLNGQEQIEENSMTAKTSQKVQNEELIFSSAPGHNLTGFDQPNTHKYPFYRQEHTRSGHTIDINDTPGNERIMIRHRSGRGIDIQSDGRILISATSQANVSDGNYELIVNQDGSLTFGNLKINVQGDFNLNVGGSYNIQAQEKTESITGNSTEFIQGTKTQTIQGSHASTIGVDDTKTVLGNQIQVVKGNKEIEVEGIFKMGSTGIMDIGSETILNAGAVDNLILKSDDMTIAPATSARIGAEGTAGTIAFFGTEAKFSGGVTATGFDGNLNGTATTAALGTVTAATGANETPPSQDDIRTLIGRSNIA